MSARTRELFALIPAGLLVTAGFLAIFLSQEALKGVGGQDRLTDASLTYGGIFLGLCVVAHLVIRLRLKHADPYLVPLVAVLACFGLVELYRIDASLARQQGTWFVVGIFITLTPEMGVALRVSGEVKAGRAVFWCYLGLVFGDLASGLLSQMLRSRRGAVAIFLLFTAAVSTVYLTMRGHSPEAYYGLCFALGLAVGYWALFVTIAAEQFGTNLRATVATTVPNFVRGALVPITIAYVAMKGGLGEVGSAAVVGTVCLGLALFSVWAMRETFTSDLDYTE